MTNEHKKLLQEKLAAAFKALNELNGIVTEEDMIWADKASSDELGSEEDEELAMSLLNLEANLREMSHAFAQ
jgi:hypothetical protein